MISLLPPILRAGDETATDFLFAPSELGVVELPF